MFCKNCGKEISDDSKFCSSCGCNLVSIKKEEVIPEQAEKAAKNEPVAEEKETESENVQKNTESAENAPETPPSQSGGVSSVIDIEKIKEKVSEIDVDEIKDKTKSFAKKEVKNYKNFKNLSLSQKIIRVLIPAIVLVVFISAIVPNDSSGEGKYISSGKTNISYEEAIGYLSKKSALPTGTESAVRAGVYSKVSIAEVIGYMFENPEIEMSSEKNGNTTIKFSGKYRYTTGGDYVYDGFVSYSMNEDGTYILRKDGSSGIFTIIDSIAIQLANSNLRY